MNTTEQVSAGPYNESWGRKRCCKCHKWKAFSNFWRNRKFRGGFEQYCKPCSRPHKQKWYNLHKDKNLAAGAKHRARYKHEALAHYCGGIVRCQCAGCNVTIEKFLTLDHINNDGAEHRKQLSGNGKNKAWVPMYTWARKNGYPSIFRVLCYNCNCGRHLNKGVCPHMEV